MRIWIWSGLAATSAAVLGTVLALPSQAAPAALRPSFEGVICTARVPALDTTFLRGLQVTPAGSIIRVADTGISVADHAELMFKLGLLQGHLMVGKELIGAKQPTLALPHFGHPVRELYDDLRPDITRRGMTQFDGELISLEALAAGKPGDPAMLAQYDKVIRILDALRATVPSELRDSERFMLGVIGEVAVLGSEDYSSSIESNRITKPVEYHDSRGYLEYADLALKQMEARPDLKGSKHLVAARAKITEMQAIVGPLLPPQKPIKTVAQYKALVAQYKKITTAPGA